MPLSSKYLVVKVLYMLILELSFQVYILRTFFSQSLDCFFFCFLKCVIYRAEVLNFNEIQNVDFSKMNGTPPPSLPNPESQTFCPMLFNRCLIFLGLMVIYIIHFELNFWCALGLCFSIFISSCSNTIC